MGVSGKEKDRHDYFFKKARSEQYRARSVYKLQEIQEKHKLLAPGQVVLDLGAAPGSWTQYVAEVVGPTGRVISVDRTAIAPGLPPQVTTLQLDMLEVTPEKLLSIAGVSRADVVVSDMAPNTSGIRSVDHARSVELCFKALQVAEQVLKPGGAFVCKVFQGADSQALTSALRACFGDVRNAKPKSSREESVEFFMVGLGYKPGAKSDAAGVKSAGWDPLADD